MKLHARRTHTSRCKICWNNSPPIIIIIGLWICMCHNINLCPIVSSWWRLCVSASACISIYTPAPCRFRYYRNICTRGRGAANVAGRVGAPSVSMLQQQQRQRQPDWSVDNERAHDARQRKSHKSRTEIWRAVLCGAQTPNAVHAHRVKGAGVSALLQFSWFIPPAATVIDVNPCVRPRMTPDPDNVSARKYAWRNFAIRRIKSVLMIFMTPIRAGRNQFRDCIAGGPIEKL